LLDLLAELADAGGDAVAPAAEPAHLANDLLLILRRVLSQVDELVADDPADLQDDGKGHCDCRQRRRDAPEAVPLKEPDRRCEQE
jgi:hypothetical protein